MAAQLNLDGDLNDMWTRIRDTATGWINRTESILDKAFHSAMNPFGTASLLDTGVQSGDVPLLDAGGDVAQSTIPDLPASRFTGPVAASLIPDLDASKIITADRSVAMDIARILSSQIPPLSSDVFTFGMAGEDVLPDRTAGVRTATGTPTRTAITQDLDGDPNDPVGPAPAVAFDTTHSYPGTGSITNGTLTLNPVLISYGPED